MNFNSHTREGVTRTFFRLGSCFADFNSHTREGVTATLSQPVNKHHISTHTPVRV